MPVSADSSDSVIHLHAFLKIFFSIMVYHRILDIASDVDSLIIQILRLFLFSTNLKLSVEDT